MAEANARAHCIAHLSDCQADGARGAAGYTYVNDRRKRERIGPDKRLAEITPAAIEQYRARRRATISRRGRAVTPVTINRELARLKRMFNAARRGLIVLNGGSPVANPMVMVSQEREHNEGDRVLSAEEFRRIHDVAAPWLQPMLLVAYDTGMREGEISLSCRDQIDLKAGTIGLK